METPCVQARVRDIEATEAKRQCTSRSRYRSKTSEPVSTGPETPVAEVDKDSKESSVEVDDEASKEEVPPKLSKGQRHKKNKQEAAAAKKAAGKPVGKVSKQHQKQ